MTNPKYNNNLWQNSVTAQLNLPEFDCDRSVDLVIVGGGFTGCSAALEAAQHGMSVVLLEAETIGFGGSGRNVGLVNAGLWTPPDEVEDLVGKEAGEKLNGILASAPDLVFSLIEQHDIQCDAIRNGTLHCAHSKTGLKDIESRFGQQVQRDAPVKLLSAAETKNRTGSSSYHGALFDPRAGTINPLKYCQGLAKAAVRAGAELFENSPALGIKRENEIWQVRTAAGVVISPNLLIATNAYSNDQLVGTRSQFTNVHYFQFATEPLTQSERKSVLPNQEGCWDSAMVMSSFRYDCEGRLLVGSVGSLDHFASGVHETWAQKKLAQIYPQLATKNLDHAWHGRIAMTKDHLPKIVELGPNAYSVFGYSGRGIGPGTTFGKAIGHTFATDDDNILPVVPQQTYSENYTKTSALYYETGSIMTHATFAAAHTISSKL